MLQEIKLLIFDFDGVIADSEVLACSVAASYAIELGARIKEEDGLACFMGKRLADVEVLITTLGGRVPPNFGNELLTRTLAAFSDRLKPVPGAVEFIRQHRTTAHCIASSSSHQRLNASLNTLHLSSEFGGVVFSADDVKRGKPCPDLFLLAVATLGFEPHEALVIEDSPAGILAGVAAGMKTIGMLAASHIPPGHAESLMAAGATAVVESFDELSRWLLD